MQPLAAKSPEEFGKSLRELREDRGVSLDFIASKSKISCQVLNALEAGSFAKLPPAVFSRTFLRQYLNILQEDPSPWIVTFDRLWKKWEEASQPFPVLGVREAPSKRWLLWIIGVLLVVAAFAALIWIQHDGERPAMQSQPTPSSILENLAPTPTPTFEASASRGELPAAEEKLIVESTDRPCWLEWRVGGQVGLRRLLPPGEQVAVELPPEGGELLLGDAGAVRVRYPGGQLVPAGRDGQVVRLRFGKTGLIQENEP
ncbi:MAG: RodZ domain-containing protein [Thermoanaerobaculaceae bacterium]